jgi:hypothetical protein
MTSVQSALLLMGIAYPLLFVVMALFALLTKLLGTLPSKDE